MLEKVIMAGFGGQGVMLIGKLLTYAGMLESKEVSWLPSYGPEMRGGTANCHVTLSDTEISSPNITEANSVIAMNKPSLYKFENIILRKGNLLINSSLIDITSDRDDISVIHVPANEIASEIGNAKVANMVMLGSYVGITNIVKKESLYIALEKSFTDKKAKLIDINKEAFERGMNL